MGHERGKFQAVIAGDVIETGINRSAELGGVVVGTAIERVPFDELPQASDQIEVRRIGRQEPQLDFQGCGQAHDHSAVLIAHVVDDQRHQSR